ncbi:MAG: ABC transporter substrate-binding protein, partial [Anaerolineae bacterium]
MNAQRLRLLILLISMVWLVAACGGAPAAPAPAKPAETKAPAPTAETKATEAPAPTEAAQPAATEAAEAPATTEAAAAKDGGEPYKIGLFFSVTGPAASLGVPERDTAMMLIEQINAKGGVPGPDGKSHPIEAIFEDDQSKPDEAVLIVKKFIEQDKVPLIIGGTGSPTSMAVIDTVTEAKIPFISNAAA